MKNSTMNAAKLYPRKLKSRLFRRRLGLFGSAGGGRIGALIRLSYL
jgi:hypothetical protein